ncbi:MAG: alpha/beta fold hydrolase [Alphaproteobacteria bacterium]|nr:alpha/beta fold hydrolase [Alphaproteobacteria bacterium]MBU2083207.1 alpha/beta fold hydrolase [Alphaproteobacteria bacterium]MBU2144494.1 alpha/beta fold hydrolase [Alphaproteobacteria bacterium]MBU2195491.1 alpha/beta fold hydrolase [Alphaproteobacteria bacterium]
MAEVSVDITEQALMLGQDEALAAIVTRPVMEAHAPAIIILNTGVAHRVGHHRKFVTLSRRLARAGHTVVRFDFPGLGDSPAMTTDASLLEGNLFAIREVANWIEQAFSIDRIIMLGLCSGADQSVIYAGRDTRVKGAILLDPSIPRTRRYHINDFSRRIRSRALWTNFLSGKGRIWDYTRSLFRKDGAVSVSSRQFSRPNLEHPEAISFLEGVYQGAIDNGVNLLGIFTAGQEYQHNYRTQIVDALPKVHFADRVSLHFLRDCDHTFIRESYRNYMYSLVADWLLSEFPDDRSPNHGVASGDDIESMEF